MFNCYIKIVKYNHFFLLQQPCFVGEINPYLLTCVFEKEGQIKQQNVIVFCKWQTAKIHQKHYY
jgi:hypothetical protein